MTVPKEIKDKIYSLSLRTVANGFTETEAQTAVQMILKLNQRYGIETPQKEVRISYKYEIPWDKIASEYLSPVNYKKFKLTKSFDSDLIEKISWDLIAANYLYYKDYYHFLDLTEGKWKERQGSTNKLEADKAYKRHCYEIFLKLTT